MPKKNVSTIRDVAREAQVSVATVSHVLNKTRKVKPATRQVVLEAARRLNYVPSGVARSLSTGRTNLIGMIVADVTSAYFATIIRGVEDRLWRYGYNLVLCSTDESNEKESQYLKLLLERRVDGLIVVPTGFPQPMFEEILHHHIGLVFVDRRPQVRVGPVVEIDNHQAGFQAAEHLIRLGHRRIAVITRNLNLSTANGRTQGYRHALASHGIENPEELVKVIDARVEASERAVRELMSLPEPPTAIIATNHLITLGMLSGLQKLNIRCPEDISLIGFDDFPWIPVLSPPLTVIDHPFPAICDATVQTLLAMMANLNLVEEQEGDNEPLPLDQYPDVTLPAELVIRGSCGNLAAEKRKNFSE